MWPLSLLYWLNRNDGLMLLVIQDLAIVAAEAIAIWWMVVFVRRRHVPDGLVAAAVVGTAVLGAANPWLYSAARQDFHFEALAACFAMAAAYELWAGHKWRCWLFVALTLCCGDVAGTYIAGIAHPSRPLTRRNSSWMHIGRLLAPTGGLGIVNPWIWGVILLTLLVNVLNALDAFREPNFQNFAVHLFATAGTGLLLVLVAGHTVRRLLLAGTLLAGALVSSLWFDKDHHQFLVYPASVASGLELQQVRDRTPANGQVISTFRSGRALCRATFGLHVHSR